MAPPLAAQLRPHQLTHQRQAGPRQRSRHRPPSRPCHEDAASRATPVFSVKRGLIEGLMVPARVYRALYKNTDTRESHVSCIIRICIVFLYFMYYHRLAEVCIIVGPC